MADIVLHHYPASPYSEKIRAIFDLRKPKDDGGKVTSGTFTVFA